MDIQRIISKLHPFERKVLPVIRENSPLPSICLASGLQEIEVMRALQWLENKQLLALKSETKKVVVLDANGLRYQKTGLPEKAFLQALTSEFQPLSVIAAKTKLTVEELNACIGILKQKAAIEIRKEQELAVKLGVQGSKLKFQESAEEHFLKQKFPLEFTRLDEVQKRIVDDFKRRKGILKVEEQRSITAILTELGKKVASANLGGEVINRLTPAMLKDGSWKRKQFRAYDVEINVPRINGGRIHFDNQAIDYIKRIWLDLGFKEMSGNYIQSAFWDLDALFVPQDHPAREMQDTFYLEGKAKLPSVYPKVKAAHESGGNTGSTGWGYQFSKEESEQLLLRTHTTVLSAQTISTLKRKDLPAKFFAVGRVFRNEALDWKHLFEFYQVEGIVVDPNANLKHLKGYLTQFYTKMGYSKVRMRPAHFPYTEPSLEVDVYHPVRKEWIELGGAGIFRPEVVKPLLGFECPVLAWGQGMARIIAEYWKISDIRELYNNDLKQIRDAKVWLR